MKLASVRALKQQLATETLPPLLESLSLRPLATAARTRDLPQDLSSPTAPIALGVAPGARRGDYRLAVRVQQRGGIAAKSLTRLPARIAELAKGEADVRIVGGITKRAIPWHQRRARPLVIGSSIGHYNITAGTLGAFVKCSKTGNICVLSNNHVLADEGRCRKGDDVLQQAPDDDGRVPDDKVGELERWTRFGPRGVHYVDAAIASLDDGMEYYPTWLRGRPQANLAGVRAGAIEPDDAVWKVGRTTGFTRGVVTAIELDEIYVEYDIGDVRFDNQIEIEGVGGLFSDGGDSGSLIVDSSRRACALLFAGGKEPGVNGRDLTYANPIDTVLKALNITLDL